MTAALGPRVGIWGSFDLADYGSLVQPRIFAQELQRRVPHARVYPYAPLGAEQPIAMDGGYAAAPLGAWTPARRAQLAEQLDLVAVGGSDLIDFRDDDHGFFIEGLGAELERRCPVVWHSVGVPYELDAAGAARVRDALASKRYVSVCDPLSRQRLLAARPEQEIAVVPDAAVLVSRLFPPETIRKRLDYLRAIDCYPGEERPIVLQGHASLTPDVDQVASAVREVAQPHAELPVVLATLAPAHGDAEFADALAARLGRPVYRLPPEVTLEDVVAVIANARMFVGSSLQGYLTALAFGVYAVLVSGGPSALDAFGKPAVDVRDAARLAEAIAAPLRGDAAVDADAVRALGDAVDTHFDTLAALVEESWSERLALSDASAAELARALAEAELRYDALLRAYAARGERLLMERLRVAEMLDETNGEVSAAVRLGGLLDLAEARNRLETLDAERAALQFERDRAQADLARGRGEDT